MRLEAGHLSTLGLRDKPVWTMILVICLLVKVMDGKTKLFTATVLPTCQNAIELILIHELLQIEIISYSKIDIFILRLEDSIDLRRKLILSISLHEWFHWLLIYFHSIFHSYSLLGHHIWELGSWSY